MARPQIRPLSSVLHDGSDQTFLYSTCYSRSSQVELKQHPEVSSRRQSNNLTVSNADTARGYNAYIDLLPENIQSRVHATRDLGFYEALVSRVRIDYTSKSIYTETLALLQKA